MTNDNNPWAKNHPTQDNSVQNIDELIKKLLRNYNFLQGKNYNFNIIGMFVVLVLVIVFWFLSGFYIVQPEESGVELVFGKYSDTTEPGLNYNFPSPIGRTLKVKTSAIYKEEFGFRVGDDKYAAHSGIMLTGDENIVNVSFQVQWRIVDPYKYLFNLRDDALNKTIKSASESAMRESVGQNVINFIMIGEGRSKVSSETHVLLQSTLDMYDMGVEILSVQLIKVDPPEKVIDSFRDVQSAKADKEREVNQAQAYYNDKIPRSRGQVDIIVKNAEAYRQEVINSATGEVSKFKDIYVQYKGAEGITRSRLYLETMESILQKLDKVIVGKGHDMVSYLPLQDLLKGKKNAE